ncbi:uncharacterized protein HKW66_Vig0125560 [Vigna angularis]|uniref:Uncharacterized protein n=1 Tax=Phaseolus angularis TaxID=3914 RepID=A0A8T0K6M1_PHAAN|nr:uncharacterized protein HKW66_Vig0125560 [Vigna angularis]
MGRHELKSPLELLDSTDGDRNLNAPQPPPQPNNHHQDARSGLRIDLNEILSPSVETLRDSVTDVIHTYDENPGPPSGAPAALPNGYGKAAMCVRELFGRGRALEVDKWQRR